MPEEPGRGRRGSCGTPAPLGRRQLANTGFGRGQGALAQDAHGEKFEALYATGAPSYALASLPPDAAPVAPLSGRTKDEATLRARLRDALGGDEATIVDPLGSHVRLNQSIVDQMLKPGHEDRLDGRDNYFPILPYLVRDPAEIWIGWAQGARSGIVKMRARYVKWIDTGRGHFLGLVADFDGGDFSAWTFFRGDRPSARLRSGLRVFVRAREE